MNNISFSVPLISGQTEIQELEQKVLSSTYRKLDNNTSTYSKEQIDLLISGGGGGQTSNQIIANDNSSRVICQSLGQIDFIINGQQRASIDNESINLSMDLEMQNRQINELKNPFLISDLDSPETRLQKRGGVINQGFMIDNSIFSYKERSVLGELPTKEFDAKSGFIANLHRGIQSTDAVNVSQLEDYVKKGEEINMALERIVQLNDPIQPLDAVNNQTCQSRSGKSQDGTSVDLTSIGGGVLGGALAGAISGGITSALLLSYVGSGLAGIGSVAAGVGGALQIATQVGSKLDFQNGFGQDYGQDQLIRNAAEGQLNGDPQGGSYNNGNASVAGSMMIGSLLRAVGNVNQNLFALIP